MMVEIDDLQDLWNNEGRPILDDNAINILIDIWSNIELPEEDGDGNGDEESDDDSDIPAEDDDKSDTPSSSDESDPPMPPEPKPQNPEDREYSPEGNVDESTGEVGTDPPCKPIFDPSVARMKRGETYNRWQPGGRDGYKGKIIPPTGQSRISLRDIAMQKEPGSDMHKFSGKMDLKISSVTPTAVFMPSEETYFTGYNTSDGSDVKFLADNVNNVYVKALIGSEHSVTLNYTVWCNWAPDIDNLLYYKRDWDNGLTLQDLYTAGQKIKYDFNKSLATEFRKNVPELLRIINAEYFEDLITVLEKMASPGYILDDNDNMAKELATVRRNYNFKRTMEILSGYMTSFGCGKIPIGKADMVMACVRSREGSCRHRALAFFIVGATIGIPVNYCCSDCHAYIEVYFPNVKRWTGIDLGGCPPPQPKPKDGEKKPKEPKDEREEVIKALKALGWLENEARFKKTLQAYDEYKKTGGK